MEHNSNEIATLVAAANERYTDPERNRTVNERPGETPRFEVYHFFMSLCSYKVRAVFEEKQASYISHDINIVPPVIENYYPEYVRLRVKGGEALSEPLVSGYTGRSSTETEGFDPCVVPTVVDHAAGRVLVNSKRICRYLDEVIDSGTKLMPADLHKQILKQMDIVDRTPHVAVFYGVNPEGDRRPPFLSEVMKTAHDVKIGKLEENMALVSDDQALTKAYEHKIAKERAARAFVRNEADMRAAVEEIKGIIAGLQHDLAATGGEWLLGDRFTMADVFWGISLFRMKWLGLGYIWAGGDRALVEAYSRRLFARPSIDTAAIHWPLLPPSEHVMEYYPD